jgi:hypothetical protein
MGQGFAQRGLTGSASSSVQGGTFAEVANASTTIDFSVRAGTYHLEVVNFWLSSNTTAKAYTLTLNLANGASLGRVFYAVELRSATSSPTSSTSDTTYVASTAANGSITLDSGSTQTVNTFRKRFEVDLVVATPGLLSLVVNTANAALTLGGQSNARLTLGG